MILLKPEKCIQYAARKERAMIWRGLTIFGRGLVIALCGVLIKSAGNLVGEDTISLILTTIGIIVFIAGLYMALLGMDSQLKKFKEFRLGTTRKDRLKNM